MIIRDTQDEADILTRMQAAEYEKELRAELAVSRGARRAELRAIIFEISKPERMRQNAEYRQHMVIPSGTCEPRRIANGSGHGIRIPKVARKISFAEEQALKRTRLKREGKL